MQFASVILCDDGNSYCYGCGWCVIVLPTAKRIIIISCQCVRVFFLHFFLLLLSNSIRNLQHSRSSSKEEPQRAKKKCAEKNANEIVLRHHLKYWLLRIYGKLSMPFYSKGKKGHYGLGQKINVITWLLYFLPCLFICCWFLSVTLFRAASFYKPSIRKSSSVVCGSCVLILLWLLLLLMLLPLLWPLIHIHPNKSQFIYLYFILWNEMK